MIIESLSLLVKIFKVSHNHLVLLNITEKKTHKITIELFFLRLTNKYKMFCVVFFFLTNKF